MVVVVDVVTGTRVVWRLVFPLDAPPPPNCCVIVGRSSALIGRPSKDDNKRRSLLTASMSCLPRSSSALESFGLAVPSGTVFVSISLGRDRVGDLVDVGSSVIGFALPVRLSAN